MCDMVEDEKKPEEKKEEPDKEEEKKLSIVEEAAKIRDDMFKIKEELKAENERKEKIQSEQMLGSSAGGYVENKAPKPLGDKDYAEAYEKGEVNPFKEDGYL